MSTPGRTIPAISYNYQDPYGPDMVRKIAEVGGKEMFIYQSKKPLRVAVTAVVIPPAGTELPFQQFRYDSEFDNPMEADEVARSMCLEGRERGLKVMAGSVASTTRSVLLKTTEFETFEP